MKKFFRQHLWLSITIIFLLLLAACGGGEGDEALQDSSDTDSGTIDDGTDSETILDDDIGATGSEEDSGGLPPTPDTGSKVNVTRTSPEANEPLDTAVLTPTPPANRTESQEIASTSQMDIVLLLDASGSMAEELAALQASLDNMNTQINILPTTALRYGFVVYRDQAKTESSQLFALTADWALFIANLANVTAVGGNDYPEDLNNGFYQAVVEMDWRPDAIKLLILLGDAPPHLGARNSIPYEETLEVATQQNIIIYTIGSDGLDELGRMIYQQIAQNGNGRFLLISTHPENIETATTAVYPMVEVTTAIGEIVQEVFNEQAP